LSGSPDEFRCTEKLDNSTYSTKRAALSRGQLKSDFASRAQGVCHEAANRLYQLLDLRVVLADLTLELRELGEDLLILGESFAHPDKGTDNEDAHLRGAFGVQNRGGHDRSMFRESEREITAATAWVI
jgi:hypothetical protein